MLTDKEFYDKETKKYHQVLLAQLIESVCEQTMFHVENGHQGGFVGIVPGYYQESLYAGCSVVDNGITESRINTPAGSVRIYFVDNISTISVYPITKEKQ